MGEVVAAVWEEEAGVGETEAGVVVEAVVVAAMVAVDWAFG